MDRRHIEECVQRALDMLYSRDDALLRGESSEWSVAHRLAVYIEDQFPGWNVDCEYNRQGPNGDIKRVETGECVRPDIVVHHRGRPQSDHNLLAIELKKDRSEADQGKAREYTALPTRSRRFQYQFGLTVMLGETPVVTWFEGGSKC